MDDPLSAVDANVGNQIFEKVIVGLLRKKTVLLITHYLQYLPKTHKVIVMNDGTISEYGSYQKLMSAGLDFASLIENSQSHNENENNNNNTEISLKKSATKLKTSAANVPITPSAENQQKFAKILKNEDKSGNLMEKEEKEEGAVKWTVYLQYARSAGSWTLIFFVFVTLIAAQLIKQFTDWWYFFSFHFNLI